MPHLADNGRLKKKAERMRRENFLITNALRTIGLRYWKAVMIFNPHLTTRYYVARPGYQWVDFIFADKKRKLHAIVWYPKWGKNNPHKYQLNWMNEKKRFLSERGIETLILKRGDTEQNYYARILMFLQLTHGRRGLGS